MKHRTHLFLVGLALLILTPMSAVAEDFAGGIELGMSPAAEELEAFVSYVDGLERAGDPELAHLAASARKTLDAVAAADVEQFLAAKAIYDYRLETLSEASLEALEGIRQNLQARTKPALFATELPFQKINVTYGCGAELLCDNGSRISCRCANPNGTCYYNPNANSWGGRVECNCAGSSFDVNRSCPYDPPACNPSCNIQCAPTGGICSHGTCFCF